jgi:hypothetical protein
VGDINALAGSTVAPGDTLGPTLTCTNATFAFTSHFKVQLNGNTALDAGAGTVDLGNAAWDVAPMLDPSYSPSPGSSYALITAASVVGQFDSYPDGDVFAAGFTNLFQINYGSGEVDLTCLF